MAPYTRYLIASAFLAVASAQSCPLTPSYFPIPDYPASGKCAPQGYDFELTLGKVSLEKARTECQEECSASGSDCAKYVIELYGSSSSSNDYEAKCLLFKEGNTATQPESCPHPGQCKLEGYSKGPGEKSPAGYNDNILPCYSAEPEAATSYCQSLLCTTITKTATATITPGASTRISNFTITNTLNQTALLTRTVDATTTLTQTTTLFTSPTVTTNLAVIQTSVTVTTVSVSTSTATSVVTTTVFDSPLTPRRRILVEKSKKAKRAAVEPPACIKSDTPTSKLSSACVVYNAPRSTVTTTTTTTLGQAIVTKINNQTLTLTRPVTETVSITVTSLTATAVVPTTIVDGQTLLTTSTNINTITATSITTVVTTTTSTSTTTVPAFTPCGLPQGYTPTGTASGVVTCTQASAPGQTNSYFRIEGGAEGKIFEGCISTGPRNITTPSGGTHLCDGTNNNANPAPGGTFTTLIEAAGMQEGFGFDGTYSNQFQDFFINSIGQTRQTGNQYWGVLRNEVFTARGGCQEQVSPADRALWAFDAFAPNRQFLRVSPEWATVTPGARVTLTVVAVNPNSGNTVPAQRAAIFDQLTDANGQVTIVAPSTPGCYQQAAEGTNNIRSNYFSLNVFSSF